MKWPHVRIGDVCDLNPRLPKTHTLNDDDAVSFVPMAAVSELSGTIQTRSTRRFAEVRKGYTPFQNNDVLFAKITPCMENGKAAIARDLVHGYGFGSTEFHVLRASENVLPEWLHFFVRQATFRHEAKRNFTGTGGQQRVPATFVANTLIPLPPLPEQRRIVDLLTRAEGIVRLRREAADKAAELIPAIFIDMFGDPASNPKDWSVHALSEVANIISGATKGRKLLPDECIELPYMRVANVKDGHLDLSEVKTIEIKRSEVAKLRIDPGDLLVTEGGDPDKLGRGALWRGEIDLCIHQNHVFKVRSHPEKLVPEYLRSLVGSQYGKAYFLSVAKKTTGIASINKTQLSAFPVLLPPMPLQCDFRKLVDSAESILAQQVDAMVKAQATFNALVAQAFAPHGSL